MTVTELLYRIKESWYYTRKSYYDTETAQNYMDVLEGKGIVYMFWNN